MALSLYHIGMAVLESFVGGSWTGSPNDGVPLVDASTGEAICSIDSGGVDFDAAVRYGRKVGNPALNELTIHERALVLKEIGLLLLSEPVKAELYDVSAKTGATAKDSWIDIDGGASVLLTYSSKARKELPNSNVVVDGPTEQLSPDGSFMATHILTPKRGAFVQINAYNFPVWGMLEKFAPAFIAGVPSIVKPASQTAYLTEAAVRIMLDTGLLPEGALQLICGSAGDLLDHLDGQDSVGFTGSASTATMLRAHPNIIARSVPFVAEADSLNSAILAPCATPDTPEFGHFIAEVAREMTVKAGQKCTAIRRAFVPEALIDDASAALEAALAEVVVGDPRDEATTMGPVASADQADEVRRAVAALEVDATAIVSGGGTETMLAPTLLRANDRRGAAIHVTEAFGPVSTLVPYADIDEAIDLVALGDGSLVASVFGADPAEVRALSLGIAAHHGRVLVVDDVAAKRSTGHGSPLPHLVHGGPGRAGGGAEMGGVRGVFHHMQRTAIQGSPGMLTEITGEYVEGAPTTDNGHPFKLGFDDLAIGDSITTEPRTVTSEDIEHFASFTGDEFYAHMDEEAAARSPIFGGIVAHGYLVLSFAAGLFVDPPEGPVLANYGLDRLRFATPTKPGDEIHVVLTCKRKTWLEPRGYGEVAWDTRVFNQAGELAAVYDVLTMVGR